MPLLRSYPGVFASVYKHAAPTEQFPNRLSEKASVETQWEYLVVAGGSQNLSSLGIGEKMNKQEGSSFNREAVALERNLDKLGARGWELVSVAGEPRDPVFYLKRAKANH